ncbi:MAG: sporulation protein [Spirochaetota bacterium]|nr:sporulation protein [Spirochaetota bacterium]
MGVFGKMKAAFGVGGAKIKILLDSEEAVFDQGDVITGKIEVTGGNAEQTINELRLELRLKWIQPGDVVETVDVYGFVNVYEEGDEKHDEVLDEIVLDEPFKVDSNYKNTFDFDFEIPYDASISLDKEIIYYLYARADIPGGVDAKDKIIVEIVPSYEIQAVEKTLEDTFGFGFEGEYSDEGWVMVEFAIPQNFHSNSNRVGLMMKNEDDSLNVELITDLGDMSLGEYIRSFVVRQEIPKYQIIMPYQQIVPNNGDADLKKIAEIFKKVFADLRWI